MEWRLRAWTVMRHSDPIGGISIFDSGRMETNEHLEGRHEWGNDIRLRALLKRERGGVLQSEIDRHSSRWCRFLFNIDYFLLGATRRQRSSQFFSMRSERRGPGTESIELYLFPVLQNKYCAANRQH